RSHARDQQRRRYEPDRRAVSRSVFRIVGISRPGAAKSVAHADCESLRSANQTAPRHAASLTYSKSPGLLSMPTRGGAIQPANRAGSYTGFMSEAMKSP